MSLSALFYSSWRKREDINNAPSLVPRRALGEPGLSSSRIFLTKKNKKWAFRLFFILPGGSERIRTSETLLPTRFRVVRLQPLGHASTSNLITITSQLELRYNIAMYKEYEGKEVTVLVSSRGDGILQYDGTMTKGDHVVELTNVTISQLIAQLNRNVFGQGSALYTFDRSIPKLTINEDYVISVQAK